MCIGLLILPPMNYLRYVTQQNKDPFTDEFYSKLAEMIAANAFRSLAPADDPTAPDFDPEDVGHLLHYASVCSEFHFLSSKSRLL